VAKVGDNRPSDLQDWAVKKEPSAREQNDHETSITAGQS